MVSAPSSFFPQVSLSLPLFTPLITPWLFPTFICAFRFFRWKSAVPPFSNRDYHRPRIFPFFPTFSLFFSFPPFVFFSSWKSPPSQANTFVTRQPTCPDPLRTFHDILSFLLSPSPSYMVAAYRGAGSMDLLPPAILSAPISFFAITLFPQVVNCFVGPVAARRAPLRREVKLALSFTAFPTVPLPIPRRPIPEAAGWTNSSLHGTFLFSPQSDPA